jgi:hypothetical protein
VTGALDEVVTGALDVVVVVGVPTQTCESWKSEGMPAFGSTFA